MGLSVQPVILLTAQPTVLRNVRNRARERSVDTAVYIEEMFATGHDAANRAVFTEHGPDEENVVGDRAARRKARHGQDHKGREDAWLREENASGMTWCQRS
jgi:hypothetical protein